MPLNPVTVDTLDHLANFVAHASIALGTGYSSTSGFSAACWVRHITRH